MGINNEQRYELSIINIDNRSTRFLGSVPLLPRRTSFTRNSRFSQTENRFSDENANRKNWVLYCEEIYSPHSQNLHCSILSFVTTVDDTKIKQIEDGRKSGFEGETLRP